MKRRDRRAAMTFNNCTLFFNSTGNYIRYCHKIYSLHFKMKKREYLEKELHIYDA